MSVVNFSDLPDSTRIWIYGAERKLSDEETSLLEKRMTAFLKQWAAHKRELRTGWRLEYQQFVIIAVDESMMAASGCSIDSLVRNLANLEHEIDCQIVGTAHLVFFRNESNEIEAITRPEFKERVTEGIVDENTVVFNNIISTLGELRDRKWETAMRSSWHQQAFGKAA